MDIMSLPLITYSLPFAIAGLLSSKHYKAFSAFMTFISIFWVIYSLAESFERFSEIDWGTLDLYSILIELNGFLSAEIVFALFIAIISFVTIGFLFTAPPRQEKDEAPE